MPMYTYRCENCENQFDERQNFTDEPLNKCPKCSQEALQKVYRPARVVFKGSGYYVTDNKSQSPTSRNGKSEVSENGEKEVKSEKESKEKTSTEKSETNKETKPVSEKKPKEKTEVKK